MLYSESDSPLRYRINRLGGRSKQEKWILQAELFNEIHRWTRLAWSQIEKEGPDKRLAARYYAVARDFLKAAAEVWGERLGRSKFHGDQTGHAQGHACGSARTWPRRIRSRRRAGWSAGGNGFRPGPSRRANSATKAFTNGSRPKGQVERVSRIHRELSRWRASRCVPQARLEFAFGWRFIEAMNRPCVQVSKSNYERINESPIKPSSSLSKQPAVWPPFPPWRAWRSLMSTPQGNETCKWL
jgi:hypothetical protein